MFKYLSFLGILIFLFSCKKEKTTWDTNWSAPLVHGTLNLEDVIPSENISTNSEGFISLVYDETVFSLEVDTIFKVKDTTINYAYAIGISSLTLNPGFSFPDTLNQSYATGDIELKRVIVKEGKVTIGIYSEWNGNTELSFRFPLVLENGLSQFQRTYFLPPGTIASPSYTSETIDLSQLDMNLTGFSGNFLNLLTVIFEMGSAEATNSINVTNADSIRYSIAFENVVPDYAKGYFGQHHFSDTVGMKIPFMDQVLSGQFNIDSMDLNLSVKNGFNLLASAKITKITGINSKTGTEVDLVFPLLGSQLNINPASGGLYDYVPSSYPLAINTVNSNIASFISNLPDSIAIGYIVDINPNGNLTAGSDEFFPGSSIDLDLTGNFPLHFQSQNLIITDTMKLNFSTGSSVDLNNAQLLLSYVNGFPFAATPSLVVLDDNQAVLATLDANQMMSSGQFNSSDNSTTPSAGEIIFTLSADDMVALENGTQLGLLITFNTDQAAFVKVDPNCNFAFNLRANFSMKLSL